MFRQNPVCAFFDELIGRRSTSSEAWSKFHKLLSEHIDDFSAALETNVSGEDLIHLLTLLLIPVARSGFRNGARREQLFASAERIGIHVLPVHFYTPLPDTTSLDPRIWGHRFDSSGAWLLNEEGQLKLVSALSRWAEELRDVPSETQSPSHFSWGNPAITPTDAAVYYAFIREFRPRSVIEVGAGYSTLIAARACLKTGDTELCAIEPYPMEALARGVPGVKKLLPIPVQDVPVSCFEALRENDILFIDSTHVSKTGSDVNHLIFNIIPRLAPGVIIHFHDIFLPWDYPESWVKDKHIFWNEQYLLLAFLLFNTHFEVLLSTQFLGRQHPDLLRRAFPFGPVPGGGSFWLRRLPARRSCDAA